MNRILIMVALLALLIRPATAADGVGEAWPVDFVLTVKAVPDDMDWFPDAFIKLLRQENIQSAAPGVRATCEFTYMKKKAFRVDVTLEQKGTRHVRDLSFGIVTPETESTQAAVGRFRNDFLRALGAFEEQASNTSQASTSKQWDIDPLVDLDAKTRFAGTNRPLPGEDERIFAFRNQEASKREYYAAAKRHLAGEGGEAARRNAAIFRKYISTRNVQAVVFCLDAKRRIGEFEDAYRHINLDTENPVECLILAYAMRLKGRPNRVVIEYLERAKKHSDGKLGSRALTDLVSLGGQH